jgi:hypothetical protein
LLPFPEYQPEKKEQDIKTEDKRKKQSEIGNIRIGKRGNPVGKSGDK